MTRSHRRPERRRRATSRAPRIPAELIATCATIGATTLRERRRSQREARHPPRPSSRPWSRPSPIGLRRDPRAAHRRGSPRARVAPATRARRRTRSRSTRVPIAADAVGARRRAGRSGTAAPRRSPSPGAHARRGGTRARRRLQAATRSSAKNTRVAGSAAPMATTRRSPGASLRPSAARSGSPRAPAPGLPTTRHSRATMATAATAAPRFAGTSQRRTVLALRRQAGREHERGDRQLVRLDPFHEHRSAGGDGEVNPAPRGSGAIAPRSRNALVTTSRPSR